MKCEAHRCNLLYPAHVMRFVAAYAGINETHYHIYLSSEIININVRLK